MNIQETALPGAFIIEWEPHVDQRGFFARTFCRQEFSKIRNDIEFVQSNVSHNEKAGTTRGMHFQLPPFTEAKLISCIRGSALDVIIDIRQWSDTFLQHITVDLTADNERMVFVPEGFAHGFQTLEDNTRLAYHHTAYYQPGSEGGLRYNDSRLGIQWPVKDIIISEKDATYPLLDDEFTGIQTDDH